MAQMQDTPPDPTPDAPKQENLRRKKTTLGPKRHLTTTEPIPLNQLIEIGLQDRFVQAIVGVVVIAVAASFAISALGSGPKAIITLAFSLSFGVVLIILRTIITNIDQPFVKFACFMSTGIIMLVFMSFTLFLIPAALICWPAPYAQLLGLAYCPRSPMTSTETTSQTSCPSRPSVPGVVLIPAGSQKPSFHNCSKIGLEPSERLICADYELSLADAEMGDAYSAQLNQKTGVEFRAFKQAQNNWIRARDQRCEIPASGNCRAEDLADRKSCMLIETKNRMNELLKAR